jgi:hypothetical protein
MSIVVIPTLAMFSASGVTRTDGLCFNQRYFCELVPLVAVAFAWGVEGVVRRRTAFLAGGLAGVTLAMAALAPHHLLTGRHYMVMYFPLALSVLLAGAWGVELAGRVGTNGAGGHGAFLALTVGASLAWATAIHLGDDVKADRILRLSRQDYLRQLRPFLEDHSAVFASGPIKDALGKIQMELDVVIADPAIDRAGTTKELVDTFLMQGRRVFFLPKVLPRDLLDSIFTGRRIRYLGSPTLLIEVGAIAP